MSETAVMRSPVGPLTITVDDTGRLVRCEFGTALPHSRLPPFAVACEDAHPSRPLVHDHPAAVVRQLEEYFAGTRTRFELELAFHGTPFQREVWSALCSIPYGETASYAEIANLIGNRKAVRAVGAANGANPIAIIVPCHRVVGRDGSLVGYAGGIDTKIALLRLEQRQQQLL